MENEHTQAPAAAPHRGDDVPSHDPAQDVNRTYSWDKLRRFRCVTWLTAILQLTALGGCEFVDPSGDLAGDEVDSVSGGLWGGPIVYWPGNPPMIPVCFENPSSGWIQATSFNVKEETARMWVREAVEGQWSRYARVNFTEWDTCTAGAPGIHIRINKTGGSSAGGGKLNDGVTDGVKLNLYYDDRPNDCQASEANLKHCVQAVALHEFGHALGFGHEEQRPDISGNGTGNCAKLDSPDDPQLYGAYDIDSVMSYCGQPINDISTWKVRLSPGDIASVQHAYGRRRAGQLVNARGADMLSANFLVAPEVFIWDGDEAAGQRWRYDVSSQTFKASSGGKTVCLDTYPGTTGTPMKATNCIIDGFQRFPLRDVFVRGFGGLCLDVPGGSTAEGTKLQVWQCGAFGGSNQRWHIEGLRIRFGSSNKCVTFSPIQGHSLFLSECGGVNGSRQFFTLAESGSILFHDSSTGTRCMDVEGPTDASYMAGHGLPVNGARVQTFECRTEQLNQKWNISGSFKSESSGKCIDVQNAGNGNGTTVQSYDCNGTVAQEWDYYFHQ